MIDALVDRLSAELTDRYALYLDTFVVDLHGTESFIEFRCGFSLRVDHRFQRFTLKVPALLGSSDEERNMVIVVIFEELQAKIDEAIAAHKTIAN